MRKKQFVMIMSVLFITTATMFLSSVTLEKELLAAKEIAEELFEQDDRNGIATVKYLKGLDEQEDYILVTRGKNGYAIFDKETMGLM